jgi:hypothetical protein
MANMSGFVGSYNARRQADQAAQHKAYQAKLNAKNAFLARRDQINELVKLTFWAVGKATFFCPQRGTKTMAKAYETANMLAKIGGEDFEGAVSVLRWAKTGPLAYKDACDVMLIAEHD